MYKFLEHTADLKFQATGATLEEAFAESARAMYSFIIDIKKIKPVIEKKITIESENHEALLFDFLSEFLVFIDTKGFLLNDVKSIKIQQTDKGFRLNASVVGDTINGKYETGGDIKAVTYNDMFIKKEGNQWVIQVLCDI
ncbi:archease [Candidatus Woesearchaeota archaeon]|nr:archease [Candidatus Woesearchaeota archaeon]